MKDLLGFSPVLPITALILLLILLGGKSLPDIMKFKVTLIVFEWAAVAIAAQALRLPHPADWVFGAVALFVTIINILLWKNLKNERE